MKYRVEIIEKLSKNFEVDASSPEEAVNQIAEKYWREEIVVESDKGADVSFRVSLVGDDRMIKRLFKKFFG